MSEKAIIDNLTAVKKEARGMLETVRAVKGKDYTDCVNQMLTVLQVQDMTSLLLGMSKDAGVPMPVLSAMADALAAAMSSILTEYVSVKGMSEDRVPEMIEDAERMRDSTQSLFKSAIKAGEKGISIGG